MAYITKKKIFGKDYYYLRESKRDGKKVRSVTLCYLGKSLDEAEKKAEGFLVGRKKEKELKTAEEKKGDMVEENVKKRVKNNNVEKEINEGEKKEEKLSIEDISTFCKMKGFVYPSSELYGGFAGFWDFGPLGVEMFDNVKRHWWNHFVKSKENMVGMEASIISHPRTWKASGHITSFKDLAVVCKKCKKSTKLEVNEFGKVNCDCGGEYEKIGEFNLLFKTNVGALDIENFEKSSKFSKKTLKEHDNSKFSTGDAYMRGETAQGMFMDFKLIQQTSRLQLPFGIAQLGRCFRNEIAPRDFLFRSREFHIGEFEFFIHPDEKKCDLLENRHLNLKLRLLDAETQEAQRTLQNGSKFSEGSLKELNIQTSPKKEELREATIGDMIKEGRLGEWHGYWLAEQILWFYDLDLTEIKIREHMADERSHYSSATFDIDYEYPFGSKEVAGNANRGQYDLTQHEKESKEKLEIFDEKSGQKVLPRVIEPTFGMERVFLAAIVKGYTGDKERGNIVLKLHPKLAPVKVAVFPIVKVDEKMVKVAREVFEDLRNEWNVVYDAGGSVGRRYARQDEIGTPFCVTVDNDSLKGKDVTIRNRNDTKQVRVKISELKDVIRGLLNGEIEFENLEKLGFSSFRSKSAASNAGKLVQ